METQTPDSQSHSAEIFSPGASVIYGLHGKCLVVSTEARTVNQESILFYKLEPVRSSLSRSAKNEPAIWLPVKTAQERGLRSTLTREQADEVIKILATREYYFSMQDDWNIVHPKLEACIRAEGAIGLAKVESYLFVLRKRLLILDPPANKFAETVHKLLYRELSEIFVESMKSLEDRTAKGFKQKLLPDS